MIQSDRMCGLRDQCENGFRDRRLTEWCRFYRQKLMLYAAGSNNQELKSKVKMQKVLFLVPKAFGSELRFEIHRKGPYSQTVDDYLNALQDAGLMDLPSCTLTDTGQAVADDIVPREPLREIVDSMKDVVVHLSEDEMLLMIYNDYPEYRRNSEEWARISSIRRSLAERMLSKHVVSVARAAELAGVLEGRFLDDLRRRGMRWRDALQGPRQHRSVGVPQRDPFGGCFGSADLRIPGRGHRRGHGRIDGQDGRTSDSRHCEDHDLGRR